MIGTFFYDENPAETHVVAILFFGPDGESFGDVQVPSFAADQVLQAGLSDAVALPIASAVAYAVFLALKLAIPLTLSGDFSVWNPAWGLLLRSEHKAPFTHPQHPIKNGAPG